MINDCICAISTFLSESAISCVLLYTPALVFFLYLDYLHP